MKTGNYTVMDVPGGKPVKMWTQSVPVEQDALRQLEKTARLPFIYKWLAVMPDVHVGKGSTIGSVIPTLNAIIPAAVGVDIGCGLAAVKTTLMASDLPDNLAPLRLAIEKAVPHGRTPGKRDKGAWDTPPKRVDQAWRELAEGFSRIVESYPRLKNTNNYNHLGTLGTGNHFIEVCLDEANAVWFMLHSGSRGIGNAIGTFFIELAKQDMRTWQINLPDQDLAYLPEGTEHFNDYVAAVEWAQHYARLNREVMMENLIQAARQVITKPFQARLEAVNCHHNYVSREHHYGQNILVTRKGAVRARQGELGIIPGSMGAKSYIVRGLGNEESFHSCFPKGTKLLTENGLMLIENVFQCADEVKLITYNSEAQQFETKQIVDKSIRIMPIAQYVVSQNGRRDNNIITCTDDHPFATYADASLVYKPVSEIAAGFGGVIVPTELGYYDSQLPATDEELTLFDPKFSMNRIRRLGPGPDGAQEVYNFTVEANHNFIVMTNYYMPLLVHNCSHGAGRVMSRSEAKRRFTVADHKAATEGVECRKDAAVIDETPAAYKPIDAVMHAQRDLVEVVYTLKQVICVKG